LFSREITFYTWAVGHAINFLKVLTEMSTGNIKKKIMFLGSKVRLVRGADNLTIIYEPIV
jgi:hypothetical protein